MTITRILLLVVAALIAVLAGVYWAKVVAAWKSVVEFYHEVVIEMKKVTWPTRDSVVGSTIVVGVSTVVLTIIIGCVDWAFGHLVSLIFKA